MSERLELTEQDRVALEQVARYGHCWSLRRRAEAILLLAQGRTPTEVAAIVTTRRDSIYIWRRNWLAQGLDGLAEGRHTGRPGMLNEEQLQYLAELADQGTYAIPQLLALLQTRYPQVSMQPQSLRRMMRQLGFRWKRTRYSLKKKTSARL
jgi:transposase